LSIFDGADADIGIRVSAGKRCALTESISYSPYVSWLASDASDSFTISFVNFSLLF